MSEPVLFRRFRHLCGEAALRDAMTDEEFWAHVLSRDAFRGEDEYDPAHEAIVGSLHGVGIGTAPPCPECGSPGACGYDDEGRPLIHAVGASDD